MRPFEIVLLLSNLAILVWCLTGRAWPLWVQTLVWVAFVVMVVQIVFEGRRWQIYAGYLVTAWLFVSLIATQIPRPGLWTVLLCVGGVLASAVLCSVLPVFEFPKPTGPYAISSVTRHLVDSSREEILGPRPGAPREMMVQIWYPADYRGPRQTFRSRAGLGIYREHLSLIMTNAAAGIPVARSPGRYPVLIFCPSWEGRRDQSIFQVEELASHGYVVVGMDHPYGSKVTVFPDGREIKSTLGDWMDFSSDEAEKASRRIAETQLKVRVGDARFVLDTLEDLDRNDQAGIFTGRLDTSRVGIFGHSFGGAVAAEACHLDQRFRAAMDLDGCLFGEAARIGVERPFLVMSSADPAPTAEAIASSTGAKRALFASSIRIGARSSARWKRMEATSSVSTVRPTRILATVHSSCRFGG